MAKKKKFTVRMFQDAETSLVTDLLNRTNAFSCYDNKTIKKARDAEQYSFGEYTYTIKHRYLDMNDYLLYVYILKKWLLVNEQAPEYVNRIDIPFTEVAKLFGMTEAYIKKDKKKAAKRFHDSIDRLTDVKVNLHDEQKKTTTFYHLLSDGSQLQEAAENIVAIIPDFILLEFRKQRYSFVNLDWMSVLKTQRAQALMRFLSSHSKRFNTHSLEFLKSLLNLNGSDVAADKEIRKAYKELVLSGFLKSFKINTKKKDGSKRKINKFSYASTQEHKVSWFKSEMVNKFKNKENQVFKDKRFMVVNDDTGINYIHYGNRVFEDAYDGSDLPF